MKLFFIHGANATPRSFNYLTKQLDAGNYEHQYASYSSGNGFFNNLDEMKSQLAKDDWFFISHSLGGIYAAHLSHYLGNRFKGSVSLSTPYGGSELSDMLMFVHPFTRLFRDTGTRSKPIAEAQQILKDMNPDRWTAVVTSTGRAPYLPMHNDGVVSLSSQVACADNMRCIELDCNHYEIMQNDHAIEIIQDQIRRPQ